MKILVTATMVLLTVFFAYWLSMMIAYGYRSEIRFWRRIIRRVFNHYFGGLRYGSR